jgi:predicted amino acid-binding ACT domain protein
MAVKASRVDMWTGSVQDKPGALAAKLAALAAAGAQLDYVMDAPWMPSTSGTGVVFLAPLRGARQTQAAKKAGLHKTKMLFAVKVEGRDRPGLGAKLTGALAEKRINLRGLSASVIGKRFVLWLALDSAKDAARTVRILNGIR